MNPEHADCYARKPIYTIGYGGRALEEFTSLLKQYGIDFVIDIRSFPDSTSRPEFAREALSASLATEGIRYVFLGTSLGGRPSDTECYRNGYVDYTQVRQKQWFRDGIERVCTAANKCLSVVLMCSEASPLKCHRSKLVGRELDARRVPVEHIDQNGELMSQSQAMEKLAAGQSVLFDEPDDFARSRRRYGKPAQRGRRTR